MKTLLLVLDRNDSEWLSREWPALSSSQQVIVAAPTFEGRLVAESLAIPHNTYEREASQLNKPAIEDAARSIALSWTRLLTLQSSAAFAAVRYPVLEMQISRLALVLTEALAAQELIAQIVDKERPSRVIFGDRSHPFNSDAILVLTGSNGVEREALRALWEPEEPRRTRTLNFLQNLALTPPPVTAGLSLSDTGPWDAKSKGSRVLIFGWAGPHYADYVNPLLRGLAKHQAQVTIVLTGGEPSQGEKDLWQELGCRVIRKSSCSVVNEGSIFKQWSERGFEAAKVLFENEELRLNFRTQSGTLFFGIAAELLAKLFVQEIPRTVIELLRAEAILEAVDPDVVVSHFAVHASESCNVLPARRRGIPTLAFDHGVVSDSGARLDPYATEYYAVSGKAYQDALVQKLPVTPEKILVTGNLRLQAFPPLQDKAEVRARFGLDPHLPVCIFCDSSWWNHAQEQRHSTYRTLREVLKLKESFPELQLVFRVHHGAYYHALQKLFADLKTPGVYFQVSPHPPFMEIAPAADVVISQSSSAISEALCSGMPVIYLCASSQIQANFVGYEAIQVCDRFEKLPEMVHETLKRAPSPEEVRRLAAPYLASALSGMDGKAGERLTELVLRLADIPENQRKIGFQDWVRRLEVSCRSQNMSSIDPCRKSSPAASPDRFEAKAIPSGIANSSQTNSEGNMTPMQLQLDAFRRFEAGDWMAALNGFERLAVLQPNRQGIYLMQARCHIHLGAPGKALEMLQAELKLNPNHPDALQLLRELNSQQGGQQDRNSSESRVGKRFSIKVPGWRETMLPEVLSTPQCTGREASTAARNSASRPQGSWRNAAPVLDRIRPGLTAGSLPKVSIVIPTYNRAKMLGITLESFVQQDYPKDRFEIVVADNNSSDDTRQVVEEWQRRSAVPVKYLFEKRQGVHYARNSAAWQTCGEILYYTDDDMIADSKLLAEIIQPFVIDTLVGSVTGRILPQWEVTPPDWILKLCNNFRLSLNDLGDQMLIQEKDPGVYSCHMAMRRDIFFKSGGFNPENTAGEWIGDGETGLNIKIKELGYKFAYNGEAVIRHMIPPQRMTQEYLNKRLANQGNCDSYTDYKKHRYSERQLIERIAGHQAKVAEHSANYAARRLSNDLHWRLDRAFIDYYLNRVEYDYRLIHDARWRELVLRYDWLNEERPAQEKQTKKPSPLDEIRRSLEVLNGALA